MTDEPKPRRRAPSRMVSVTNEQRAVAARPARAHAIIGGEAKIGEGPREQITRVSGPRFTLPAQAAGAGARAVGPRQGAVQ